MEFGLLYEWQMPPGVSRADESRHFLNMMEQVKLAEEVGFTSVWSVEHHFLESFSHASAPEVLLSWIAAQTSTIRIGHGVRLLPYPYNQPIRAAEPIGDPERRIQLAKQHEAIGVDRLLLFVRYGGMPHEHTMESLRLFGGEVLSAFRQQPQRSLVAQEVGP